MELYDKYIYELLFFKVHNCMEGFKNSGTIYFNRNNNNNIALQCENYLTFVKAELTKDNCGIITFLLGGLVHFV